MNIFSFAQPIYLSGTNGKAVILFHGWSGTPFDMSFIAKELNIRGFTVYVPRLSGHGTNQEDFVKSNWIDWVRDSESAYLRMVESFGSPNVYVGGLSMGGCLTLLLAKKFNIPKIALFAPALIAKDRMVYLTPILSLFTKTLAKTSRKTSENPEYQEFLDAYENVTWVEPSADLLKIQLKTRWSLGSIPTSTQVGVWIAKNDEALDVSKTLSYLTSRVKQTYVFLKETGQHVIVNFDQKEAIANEVGWFLQ